jgi:hypothetical protein
MPWNECKPMDERLRFIARLLEGEKMAPLCRESPRCGRPPLMQVVEGGAVVNGARQRPRQGQQMSRTHPLGCVGIIYTLRCIEPDLVASDHVSI